MRAEIVRCSCLAFLVAALGLFAWHGAQVIQKQAATGCTIADLIVKGGRGNTERCLDDLVIFGSRRGAFILCVVVLGLNIYLSLTAVLLLIWQRAPILRRCCLAFWGARGKWASTVAFGKALWHRIRRHFHIKFAQDLEAASSQQEFERQRLFRAKSMLNIVSVPAVQVLMWRTYMTSTSLLSAKSDVEADRAVVLYLCHSPAVLLMFVMCVITILGMVPSCFTLGGLDCANVFLSGMWAWKAALATDRYYDFECAWTFPCRAIQGLVLGNARLTILLHSAVSAIGIVLGLYRERETSDPMLLRGRMTRDVLILLAISVVTWAFEQIQLAEAQAKAHAQNSDHGLALVHQVLSCMCDAVVRLDAKLCLTKPCPQLASLLLRGGPVSVGARFTSLMPPEDAGRLRDCLDRCVRSGQEKASLEKDPPTAQGTGLSSGLAGLCHVNLKDGANSKLPVALFYGCVLDVEGQPSYLIGIQEDSEGKSYPDGTDRLGPPKLGEDQLATLLEVSRAEQSVRTLSLGSSEGTGGDVKPPYLWVDTGSSNLPVLDCSVAFTLLSGPASTCDALCKCLSADDLAQVHAWLANQPACCSCPVRLRPVGAGWTYACSLSIDSAQDPPLVSSSAIPVCLAVKDLQMLCDKRLPGQQLAGDILNESRSRQGHLKTSPSTKGEEGFNVVVSFSSGSIMGIKGGCTQHHRWFGKHSSLYDLLERPKDLKASLKAAVRRCAEYEGDESLDDESLDMQLGSFIFRQPGSEEPPCRLTGDITLLDILGGDSQQVILRIGNLLDLDSPAARGNASSRGTGTVTLDAQILGCPSHRTAL